MEKAFDLVMSVLRPQFDAMPITENDYLHKSGLIYCAKCHTPKQTMIDLLGDEIKVKVLCDCQAHELDREEEADRIRKRKEALARSRDNNIDNKAWHDSSFELDDKRDRAASGKAKAYVDVFDKMYSTDTGLLMYGGLGSGKTYLAACIANALLESGKRVMMTNLTSLISNVNADFGADRDYWMSRISRVDLLVLDDFGVERTTEYAIEQSYEIVNTRYKSGKPMVITTNLTLQEMQQEPLLQKRRIFDRVIEKCIPVLVQGDSRRREIAEAKRREAMTLLEGSV